MINKVLLWLVELFQGCLQRVHSVQVSLAGSVARSVTTCLLSTIQEEVLDTVRHQILDQLDGMIKCCVLALITHGMIHSSISSKVDSLEEGKRSSNSDECSDGVGWKGLDSGDENENIWTVSRKNLDIALHVDRLLTRIHCVNSMSIAIEGEIFRYSSAPKERVVLRH